MEAVDRGESVGLMEPMLIPEGARRRGEIIDRTLALAQKSTGLRRALPDSLLPSLATLVRAMNCYYSNLIEGHDTHPIEIERALRQDFSTDSRKRDLQREARAHIAVQEWIDAGGLRGDALTPEGICEIHQRFCRDLPDELLWAEDLEATARVSVVPGAWRGRDVRVGRHLAVSPGAVPRFLARFAQAYRKLGRADTILAAACAHHRLLWIHPFVDGNGRVARLMSHAILLETLDSGAIWSVARGLARNVDAYQRHLAACDSPRQNDLDGRGQLSESALADFVCFFLDLCIDQVDFMENLMQPDRLRGRVRRWAQEAIERGRLPPKAEVVLDALLYRGALPRGEVPGIVGTGDRQARRIVSALSEEGVVASESSRAPLVLAFPARLASDWMPGLFPSAH
ncbi:cell filamentation protein Fic [Thiocystis minor]|nr:cell filamentation protein Fic [Thiocystis minor]